MNDSQQEAYLWVLTGTAISYQLIWIALAAWILAAILRKIFNRPKRKRR